MSGYTKGPWKNGYDDGSGEEIVRQDFKGIEGKSIVVARWGCGCCKDDSPLTEEEKANVRLIAAAPEMFEVIEALLNADDVTLEQGFVERLKQIATKVYGDGKLWDGKAKL
jgi:hypothetical protein